MSLRGNTRFTLRVRTLEHASHSGMFGGAVPDAMMATVKLLATLWDEDGAVAVDGTRRNGMPRPRRTARRRCATRRGCPAGVSPIGTRHDPQPHLEQAVDHRDRASTRPSVANASNTLSPEIAVVISARIAPGQPARDAYAAIEAHLRAHAPFGAQLTFSDQDYGDAFLVDTSGWAVAAARDALHEGYGVEPVDIGVGGSIPFIADLVREFPGAQILVTGVEDPHARAHSPNESLHLETFRNAVLSEALLLEKLDARVARD